jgi:FecR protein
MMQAKRIAPRTAYARLALVLVGSALLGACQSLQSSAPAEVQAGGWRVVERLGDARYLAPDASGWAPALPAATLPAGSEVTTGAGGRVILARGGDHISAGPTSRFSLPPAAPGSSLVQQAGGLRYRVAPTTTGALVVDTPFLEIAVRGTVFDVTVSPTATEVTVEAGQVRIATPDGLRHIELEAGQSAYAGGPTGVGLAFRRAQGEPAEQVEAIILPAMHPKPGLIEGRSLLAPLTIEAAAAHRASSSSTAASEAAVPIATAATTPIEFAARAAAEGDRPGSRKLDGAAATAPAPLELPVAVEAEADRTRAAPAAAGAANAPETRRELAAPTPPSPNARLFDRLSDGMVDAVPAARRIEQPLRDARSI